MIFIFGLSPCKSQRIHVASLGRFCHVLFTHEFLHFKFNLRDVAWVQGPVLSERGFSETIHAGPGSLMVCTRMTRMRTSTTSQAGTEEQQTLYCLRHVCCSQQALDEQLQYSKRPSQRTSKSTPPRYPEPCRETPHFSEEFPEPIV